jgi:hypothetical protein
VDRLRKHLTYANAMSSLAVFLVLGGATAFAASQLGKNSVGTKQLKRNAVTAAKIKKNAVTSAKIKNDAVTGSKVQDGSLVGADINLGTVGTVPSAASANGLVGQTPFFVRLGFGQSQVLASNGAVSLVAECLAGAEDEVRITARTTVNGAILAGVDNLEGSSAAEFLNTDTVATDAELIEETATTGATRVANDIDDGFVLGPEGKMLTANTEGVALGLNYGQPGCLAAGVINAVG